MSINLNDSISDAIVKMSEGNPGAVRVLMDLLQSGDGVMLILSLDDMNIRGSSIWIAFKDFAGQDLEVFKAAIQARDPEMVRVVNAATAF